MDQQRREKLDAITVGAIRDNYLDRLDSQIHTLNGLIRRGGQHRMEAEKYLTETIGETLTKLDNIDSEAGLLLLFEKPKGGMATID